MYNSFFSFLPNQKQEKPECELHASVSVGLTAEGTIHIDGSFCCCRDCN